MADIIDIRDALLARRATDMLRDAASKAAAECAAGGLSYDAHDALMEATMRALSVGNCVGYSITLRADRAAPAKSNDVLRNVLEMVAAECDARILSAEGRGYMINGVFAALGSGWRVERVAA